MTTTTTSPELDPALVAEKSALSDVDKALFDIETVEEWREYQKDALASHISTASRLDLFSGEYRKSFADGVDDSLEAYLAAKGITPDTSDNYDEIRDIYRGASIDKLPDADWVLAPSDRGGHKHGSSRLSPRNVVEDVIALRASRSSTKLDDTTDEDLGEGSDDVEVPTLLDDTEKKTASEDLEKLRKKYAAELSERSKKMGLWERTHAMDETREAYADLLGGIATDMYLAGEQAGVEHDQLVKTIDDFINENMTAFVGDMEQSRLDTARSRNRFLQWGIDKWGSWSTPDGAKLHQKIFSKGNLKKAAVFAVPGAALGAAFAAAGAAAAVAAAGVGAYRIGRTVASAKLNQAAGETTVAHKQAEDIRQLMADRGNAVHTEMLQIAQERAGEFRKQNRNRMLGALGISLAASGVGAAVHEIVSAGGVGKAIEKLTGKIHEWRGADSDHGSAFSQSGKPAQYESNFTGSANAAEHRAGFDTYVSDTKGRGSIGKSLGDQLPRVDTRVSSLGAKVDYDSYIGEHTAGSRVTAGEGWYQTFKELGISKSHRAELLKELGPQLKQMGWAYKMPDGLWGIGQKGELPHDVARLIVERAHEHGFITMGAEHHGVPAELVRIDRGEGILQSLKDAGVAKPTLADVHAIEGALEHARVAYDAPQLGGAGLYYHDGVMPDKGIAIFQDYADNRVLDNSVATLQRSAAETTGFTPTQHSSMVYSGEGRVGASNTDVFTPTTPGHESMVYAGNGNVVPITNAPSSTLSGLRGLDALTGSGQSFDARDALSDSATIERLFSTDNVTALNARPELQDTLAIMSKDIQHYTYANGKPVVTAKISSGKVVWEFNQVPAGEAIPSAVKRIASQYKDALMTRLSAA